MAQVTALDRIFKMDLGFVSDPPVLMAAHSNHILQPGTKWNWTGKSADETEQHAIFCVLGRKYQVRCSWFDSLIST